MNRFVTLLLIISASFYGLAQNNYLDEKLKEHFEFYFDGKKYDVNTYYSANNTIDIPTILEIRNHNDLLRFTDLIGIRGMTITGISEWYKKIALYYSESSSTRSETHMTLFLRNNILFVDCAFTKRRLKNLINAQYSFCNINKPITDGMDVVDLISDFPLSALLSSYDYSAAEKNLERRSFDLFIAKYDDISFYQHYTNIHDYLENKYNIIVASKTKQYSIQSPEFFQRFNDKDEFVGLDINVNEQLKFYDMEALRRLLGLSDKKRSIKSYIQKDKVFLYSKPTEKNKTNKYIIKNEPVHIVDEFIDDLRYLWLKVKYKSKNKIIEYWIKGDSFSPF